MSEIAKDNQTPGAAGQPAKKGSKKLIIIIALVVVLLGGGGGGFYYWKTSSVAAAEAGDKNSKKSKSRKEKETVETAKEEPAKEDKSQKKGDEASSLKDSLPDDSDVTSVIELQPFIINLADTESARYLRLSVSLGVGGEKGGSEKPDQVFTTRVRNAMLAVLSNKKSDEVLSVEGKAKLRKELLSAAQAASEEPEVHAIYITDFIVQL